MTFLTSQASYDYILWWLFAHLFYVTDKLFVSFTVAFYICSSFNSCLFSNKRKYFTLYICRASLLVYLTILRDILHGNIPMKPHNYQNNSGKGIINNRIWILYQ